jgi:hypothetical protein
MHGFSFFTEFPPMFQESGAGAFVPFDRVRVVLRRQDGSIAIDTVINFPAGQSEVSVSLNIPLGVDAPSTGEPLALSLKYVNTRGDTVFSGGPSTVLARPNTPGSTAPAPVTVPVQYTGTGSSAVRVVIAPRTGSANTGGTFAFSAIALDAAGVQVAGTPIGWSSLDARAEVPIISQGSGNALVRGTSRIRAVIPNGAADTVDLTIVPVPSVVQAVSGSGQAGVIRSLLPQPVVARVRAFDQGTMEGVPVTFTPTGGGSVGASTVLTDANGLASTTWRLGSTPGTQTVSASVAGVATAATFTANAGAKPAVRLAFGTSTAPAQAAVPFAVVVHALDEDGVIVQNFNSPVTLTLTGGAANAVLTGGGAVNAVAGVASFPATSVNLVGQGYRLNAASTGITAAVGNAFDVTPAAPNKLIFSTQPPASIVAGTPLPRVAITVKDRADNTVTSFNGPIVMSLRDNPTGDTLRGPLTVNAVNGIANFDALRLRRAGIAYTLLAQSALGGEVRSDPFNVLVGAARSCSITRGNNQVRLPGSVLDTITVFVADSVGNGVPNVQVQVNVAEGGGTIREGTMRTDASGRADIFWTLGPRGGANSLSVSCEGITQVQTVNAFQPVIRLRFIAQPTEGTAGRALSPAFTVQAQDTTGASYRGTFGISLGIIAANGALVTGQDFATTPPTGLATFSGTIVRKAGTGYRLVAFGPGLRPDTSAAFNIANAPAYQIVADSGRNQTAAVNAPLANAFVARVVDSLGNAVPNVNVTWAPVTGGGSIAPTFTTSDANGRVRAVRTHGPTAGVQTATASSDGSVGCGLCLLQPTVASPLVGSPLNFATLAVAGGATQLGVTTQPSGAVTGFVLTQQPVIELRDAFGNRSTSTLAVTAAVASGSGVLSGTTTVNAVNGVATFSNLKITGLGVHTLTFTAPGLASTTSASFTVLASPPTQLTVGTQPSGAVSGNALTQQPVIQLRDVNGNIVIGATNNVTASVFSGSGTLVGTTTVAAVDGVATFTNLQVNGAGAHQLSFAAASLPTVQSASFTVTQVATSLAIATQPSASATTNIAFPQQPVIQIRDAANLLIANATTPVSVALASGTGTLSGTTTVNAVNGIATFSGLKIVGSGAHTLTFTSGTLTAATSNNISVTLAPPTQLAVTTPPAGAVSGAAFATQPVVQLRDGTGLLVPDATNSVTVAITAGTGTLVGTQTVAAVGGVATFTNLQINGVGAHTLSFTSGTLTPATATVTVTQVPVALAITTQPSASATTNIAFPQQPVVQVRDAGNARVVGSTVEVTAAIASGTGTLAGTTTVSAVDGIATFTNLRIVGSGAHTLTFTSGTLAAATSSNISVTIAPPTQLAVTTPPAGAVSGAAFTTQPVVQLRDGTGLLVPDATNSVTAAITTGSGTLVGTTTVSAVGGVATFTNLQINGVGAHTLTFTSSGLTSATATVTVTQVPVALAITTQPSASATTNVAFPQQPVLQVRDAGNARVVGSTVEVTAAIATGTGTLAGTTTVSAVDGIATFTNLRIVGSGAHTLTFTSGTLSAATSSNISVTLAPPTQLAVTTPPAGGVSGTPFTTQPVVELRDATGLLVPDATNSVTAAITAGSGTLVGTTTVAAVGGVATFTNLQINGVGAHTLTFTSSGLTSATATTPTVTQTAAGLAIATQPAGATSGAPFSTQPTVQIRDAGGVFMATATNAVTVALASGSGTLVGGPLTVNAVNGVATFSGLQINGSGAHTLTFTAGSLTAATSSAFAVTQTVASLAITTQPAGAAGASLTTQPVVELRDLAGLLVQGATNQVTASIASGNGTLTGPATRNAVNGVVTYTNLLITGCGNHTLAFSATGATGATSNVFSVGACVPDVKLNVGSTAAASVQAGQQITIPVTLDMATAFGENVASLQYVLNWDNTKFDFVSGAANAAAAAAGFSPTVNTTTAAAGSVSVAHFNASSSTTATLAMFDLVLQAKPTGTTVATPVTATTIVAGNAGGGAVTVTPRNLSVTIAAGPGLSVGTQPGGAVSGNTLTQQPVIQLRDAGGALMTGATNLVTAQITSGSGTLVGTTSVAAVAGVATFANLRIDGAGAHTLTFTATGFTSVASASFSVTQVATSLAVITQPAGAATGVVFTTQPVVEVRDAAGLRILTATNDITVSKASGTGTLAGTLTVGAVAGRATFTNLVITGTGNHTLAFATGGVTGATSATFNVSALPASKLAITTQPSGAVSGTAFTAQPIVRIEDVNSNVVDGATDNVTVAIASGTGTLVGTTTRAAVNGVVNFSGLQINGVGDHTLIFTSGSLTTATSTTISVTQTIGGLAILTQPAGAVTGVAFTTQPQVEVRDLAGLKIANSTATVTASIGSGSGTISGTTAVAAVGGTVTYTNLAITGGGSHTVTFTVAGPIGPVTATSSAFNVTVPPGVNLLVGTTPTASATNGVNILIPVTLDLSNPPAGTDVASLSYNLTWDPAKFDFISGTFAEASAAGFSTVPNTTTAATGTISIAHFHAAASVTTSTVMYNLTLRPKVSGTSGSVAASTVVAGKENSASVTVTPRNLTITITP